MNAKLFTWPRLAGAAIFAATFALGMKSGHPPSQRHATTEARPEKTRRTSRPRPERAPGAADAAAKRVTVVGSFSDSESRMLATLTLAESIPAGDFAAWLDGGWFDLRGGPELMVFTKILMDRWQLEDPDGLLAWATKNNNGAGEKVLQDWATHEPERLIDYFRQHRNDRRELALLAAVAAVSPDLALSRLKEMADSGFKGQIWNADQSLLAVLAQKSPAALEALAASLPPEIRIKAESALSKQRLAESFDGEIQRLCDRPDGWKIFATYAGDDESIGAKLIAGLADLPPEWRSGIARQAWMLMKKSNARQWWDADLEAAGFASGEAKSIRKGALGELVQSDPELAVKHFAEVELSASERKNLLRRLVQSSPDPEKVQSWIAGLPSEEDRAEATELFTQQSNAREIREAKSPEDLLLPLGHGAAGGIDFTNFSTGDWTPEQLSELTKGFQVLPDDQKQNASLAVIAALEYGNPPAGLRDEAIRYYAANPPAPTTNPTAGWDSPEKKINGYVVKLATQDPAAAGNWVQTLPAGEIKTWAQQNLITNWQQYDRKAAEAWKNSLPEAERAALQKINRGGD